MKFTEPKARFLMCRPEHFSVSYAINPWMDPTSWARDRRARAAAARQWEALHGKLIELGAAVEFVPPVPGLPDLVFTANGAVVLDRQVVLARFRHPERQREEAHFESTFRALQAHGLVDGIRKLPDKIVQEGAGDCVWDEKRKLFWMGYGPRSHFEARHAVADVFGQDVVALELADPRFYHMDTALAPLPNGEVIYLPGAFTHTGNGAIRDRVASHDRIAIAFADARRFAANTVCLGDTLIMAGCGARLRAELSERGYKVVTTSLSSFLRSGGAAFCLTLRLDRESQTRADAVDQAAVA